MEDAIMRAIAIVGVGAILPDAPDVETFWRNVTAGRDSISEVPTGRWDPALYFDPDRAAPDKTYSKIGGWVREAEWAPAKWRLPVPPRVADAMDEAQRWGLACTIRALADCGHQARPLAADRTAVILGNAMAGEKHYLTALRASFPEYARMLDAAPTFAGLPPALRAAITREWHDRLAGTLPEITEDSMPGELSNCLAGRIANLMNFRGPNFVVDAACASTMAAIRAAAEGLAAHEFDAAITGGIDRNMSAHTFVKFCKIGALSGTGSRPYAEGADGFVMGEGAVIFVLKRLADAEAAGDRIYAVIRGVGASSDGKGKGITAPNPIGQRLAIERAWAAAHLPLDTVTMVEGHGTSTAVGDVVEVRSFLEAFGPSLPRHGSVALGSVKSNIGHLKGAAGGAGLLKTALALHHRTIPPSAHFDRPNPDIAFADGPFTVPTAARPWELTNGAPRRAGVSAFGFGGTNFHVVLEEHQPGRLTAKRTSQVSVEGIPPEQAPSPAPRASAAPAALAASAATPEAAKLQAPAVDPPMMPLRGCLVLGANSVAELCERLQAIECSARKGIAASAARPAACDLQAPERVAIDYGNAAELAEKCGRVLKALHADAPSMWKALRTQGIFRGQGPKPKVAFLYTGQGSQYVNMLRTLRDRVPVVAGLFEEADRVAAPLLGKPLTAFLFADPAAPALLAAAEESLRQTAITQPSILAVDAALTRLLAAFGVVPDMVMGHSLGEYGALHAAGALSLAAAIEAVSARGREMTRVAMADNGRMAAVFAPMPEIERLLKQVDGYVVVANVNSATQAVIGGATRAVEQAVELFRSAGFAVTPLPVSHAFHTRIVAPASEPLRQVLARLEIHAPALPVVANVTGDFYPMGDDARPQVLDLLGRQVASPVQFVKGLDTLFAAGARVFVEVGPKKALYGFADEAFGQRPGVSCLFTNHPKIDDVIAFNQALCGLYAAGLGAPAVATSDHPGSHPMNDLRVTATVFHDSREAAAPAEAPSAGGRGMRRANAEYYAELGRRLAPAVEECLSLLQDDRPATTDFVAVSGAAMGLPGGARVFDDGNTGRLLRGERLIGPIPDGVRAAMAGKRITRLVKSETGEPRFDVIEDPREVIKLAARAGALDMTEEFGIPEDRLAALDHVTQLAVGAGLDALRDAGIPLVLRYKTTTKGTRLPHRWGLPDALRDETGVIFGSAFPGVDSLVSEVSRYFADKSRRDTLGVLQSLRELMNGDVDDRVRQAVERRMDELQGEIERDPYLFDRRFLLRTLAMGHSQFAELIGARGPNTQVNAACATTTHAVSLAEDWIRRGRCRRVIVITADDVTTDNLLEWFGAGFLASGAAATDERVEDAVLPFDRRRHGLVVGMGAAAVVLESAEALRERGLQPICRVLATVSANSAYHGTRLDVEHIAGVMERVVSDAEARWGLTRREIAERTVFVSHETYTPARGGSASAEATALRRVFGEQAAGIVVANTKGYTGHPMAAGIEDVAAIKMLETGLVPAVANHKELDPDLGPLNLSHGGEYPIEFALRLGAGFGSQVAMSLMRWEPPADGSRRPPEALGYGYRIADRDAWTAWLRRITTGDSTELEVVARTLRVKAAADSGSRTQKLAADSGGQIADSGSRTQKRTADSGGQIADSGPRAQKRTADSGGLAADSGPAADSRQPTADSGGLAADSGPAAGSRQPTADSKGLAADSGQTTANSTKPTADIAQPTADRAAPVAQSAGPAVAPEDIKQAVLDLVVAKTGYPAEMLDLDLDLEADLGVDTVKQAELMASIRGKYGIPRDDKLKLRDFPTLAHVIRFVEERAGLAAAHSGSRMQKLTADSGPAANSGQLTADSGGLIADSGPRMQKQTADSGGRAADSGPSTAASTKPTADAAQPTADRAAPEAQSAGPAVAPEDIKQAVLDLVVAKTGYPAEMLDLDLDLEADLGVDTVKQAELMASIRAKYAIPRDDKLKLRDFPTLAHVIRFVEERAGLSAADSGSRMQKLTADSGGLAADSGPAANSGQLTADSGPSTAASTKPTADAAQPAADTAQSTADRAAAVTQSVRPAVSPADIKQTVLDLVVAKTGYPAEMLDLDLDLEADLGVDTVKQAELMASIRAKYAIPRDDKLKLRDFPTLAHVIRFVEERAGLSAADSGPRMQKLTADSGGLAADSKPAADSRQLTANSGGRAADSEPAADSSQLTADSGGLIADSGSAARSTEPAADSRQLTPHSGQPTAGDTEPAAAGGPPVADSAQRPRWVTPRPFDEASLVPRRVPTPVLRPPLSLCKPTGVTLQAGRRVVVMCDEGGTGSLLVGHLRDLGVQCLLVGGAPSAVELTGRIHGWLAGGPIHGVYWLPALDPEGGWQYLTPETWQEATYRRVKLLGVTMRALYEQVSRPGTFLVAATRMGGHHGYEPAGAASPMGGGVSGFVKAYKRERPDALVKTVDFGTDAPPETVAGRLIDETLHDPAVVEIGYRLGERWSISLSDSEGPGEVRPLTLDSRSVFVVTGAAGSIVSAIVSDLAAASGGTFYLLDRVPPPDPANADLARFLADRDGLKRDLVERAKTAGQRVTPAMIERELAAIEREQAALAAIEGVQGAGGRPVYLQTDLTDAKAVEAAIDTVRQRSGHVDVLLHAAGIEVSRSLCNKAQAEFDLVFDVKATGFFNLLHAIGDMPLGASVVFSSVAARFGNAGQTDYAAANDLLCKASSSFRSRRPGTRAVAIDWTAWRDIGMASRGSIPMLLTQAGIEMLPPDAGIPIVRQHLVEGWAGGEVVVAGRLGYMMAEADVTGGLDLDAIRKGVGNRRPGPMIGEVRSMSVHGGLVVETGLDPAVQPFLGDHRIDGVPVLPGAMGVEAFGELAALVMPEWQVAAVEDVAFLAPFKFYKGEPRKLTLHGVFRPDGDSVVADCRLVGIRALPGRDDHETTHFTARVRLQRHVGQPERIYVPRTDGVPQVDAADIYRIYFHGPAYRVLDQACRVHRAAVGRMAATLPHNHVPADLPTVMAPRLIELAFQAAGIWDLGVNGRLSLPHAIDRVTAHVPAVAPGRTLIAIVHPDPLGSAFDADVVDETGRVYVSIRGYRVIELPGAPDAALLQPLRQAMRLELAAVPSLVGAVASAPPVMEPARAQ